MSAHRSRFKAHLIEPHLLSVEAAQLRPFLEDLKNQWRQGRLSDAEAAIWFVFLYLQKRNPQGNWWSKGAPPWSQGTAHGVAYGLECFRLRQLPESVARCLYFWSLGKWPLILREDPITPVEMLHLQAQGKRCVTLHFEKALLGEMIDGERDAFEFLLHDLVHADLFFVDPELQGSQRSFFQSLWSLWEKGCFSEAVQTDSVFAKDLFYLMSDMNSHPEHMRALLRAICVKHQLFQEGLGEKAQLSAQSQAQIQGLLECWQQEGNFQISLI